MWRYRDVFPARFGDMKMTGDAQAYGGGGGEHSHMKVM